MSESQILNLLYSDDVLHHSSLVDTHRCRVASLKLHLSCNGVCAEV